MFLTLTYNPKCFYKGIWERFIAKTTQPWMQKRFVDIKDFINRNSKPTLLKSRHKYIIRHPRL